jgi:hypothetical protein
MWMVYIYKQRCTCITGMWVANQILPTFLHHNILLYFCCVLFQQWFPHLLGGMNHDTSLRYTSTIANVAIAIYMYIRGYMKNKKYILSVTSFIFWNTKLTFQKLIKSIMKHIYIKNTTAYITNNHRSPKFWRKYRLEDRANADVWIIPGVGSGVYEE